MPKGILGYNIGLGNRDSAIYRSIVELIATSKKKQYAGIIYIFVDHMIREDGAAGVHYSGPVHSPPYTLRGYIRYHDRCHTSGISLLSTRVLTIRLYAGAVVSVARRIAKITLPLLYIFLPRDGL